MIYDLLVFIVAGSFLGVLSLPVIQILRRVFKVPEGHAGLLYQYGLYVRRCNAGRHVVLGRGWSMQLIDLRKAVINVPGQETLTADNVGIKASLLITCQVIDPAKAMHATQNWSGDLYHAAQLALRFVVGGLQIETLLEKRPDLGTQLLARVQPAAAQIGVEVHAVEIKDIVLSAELKRAYAEVLKAKQEGLAALERARGESAALRNLANAARVLEDNPSLMNLRLLQSMTSAQNAGHTFVMGVPPGFVPMNGEKARNGAN